MNEDVIVFDREYGMPFGDVSGTRKVNLIGEEENECRAKMVETAIVDDAFIEIEA